MTIPTKIGKHNNIHTIAFYNIENLFDTVNDPLTHDDAFTPKGDKRWTERRYSKKIYKLGTAIEQIGFDKAFKAPAIVGLAEVENRKVIEDLIGTNQLKNKGYEIVHYNSSDERGIDVAMIYQKRYFEVLDSKPLKVHLVDDEGEVDHTRDILYVKGKLNGELVHVYVNHWSSRRDGAEKTSHKRETAAQVVLEHLEVIKQEEDHPVTIIMGDFNDGPFNKSVEKLSSAHVYNPMRKLKSNVRGSLNYHGDWFLFDQIIFSHNLFDIEKGTHHFLRADIFDDRFLTEFKGRRKGTPFRTYRGRKYLGGYSDHFPVYIQLKLN